MGKIRQWADAAALRIEEAIVAEKLTVYYRGWTQGPMICSFSYQLVTATIANVNKFKRLGPAISHRVGIKEVRIAQDKQSFTVEIPVPARAVRTPTAKELAHHGQKFEIPVGLDTKRRPAFIDFSRSPVTLWIGPPGRGKSESLRSTLAILATRAPVDRAQFYIVSRKSAEYRDFAPMQAVREIAKNAKDARKLLDYIANILLEERGNTGTRWPAIFITIDDYPGLLNDDPGIAQAVEKISVEGRALQLFLLIGTHAAGNKRGTGQGLMDDNAAARIVYKPTSSAAGSRAGGLKADDSGVNKLTANVGDAILIVNGEPKRIATAHRSEQITHLAPIETPDEDDDDEPRHELHQAGALHQAAPAYTGSHRPTPRGAAHSDAATLGPKTENAYTRPGAVQTGATGATLPDLPTIDEKRRPTETEADEIRAHVRGRLERGETTSQRYLIKHVYGGTRERDRLGWIKEILESIDDPEPSAIYEDGTPVATNEPTGPLTEEEIFRIEADRGLIDWSQVSAAGGSK